MSKSTTVIWCSFLNQRMAKAVGLHIKVNVMGLDYDTWKTTDFEYERQCEHDEALESAQNDMADNLFDAYMSGNVNVVMEVDEYLIEDEDFFTSLRKAYEPKSWVKDRGAAMHKAYMESISEICDKIATSYDTFDKLEKAELDFKI